MWKEESTLNFEEEGKSEDPSGEQTASANLLGKIAGETAVNALSATVADSI